MAVWLTLPPTVATRPENGPQNGAGPKAEPGLMAKLGARTVVAATLRAVQLLGRQFVLGQTMADAVIEQIETSTKYAGYIDKQVEEVGRALAYENLRLPEELDYSQVTALSFEVRQTLSRQRPETLGQAARLSGVTPAAISLLLVHLKKGGFQGFARADGEVPA